MALQYRSADWIYVSGFLKESTFDTAETVEAASGFQLNEHEASISYDHTRRDGVGEGTELGFEGYVSRKAYGFTLTFPFLRPNDMAFMAAFGLGTSTGVQDGATQAYRHHSDLATDDDQIPFSIVFKEAGVQKLMTGCTISSFTITQSGEYWSGSCEGIGTRVASNADSVVAEIAEEPFTIGNAKFFTETGANVDITATASISQTAENISSATPDNITGQLSNFSFTVNNNPRVEAGFLATNSSDALCRGQAQRGATREVTAEWTQTFEADTDLTTFEGTNNKQEHMALEVVQYESAQGVIAGGGAMYYGFNIIIPRGNLDVIGSSADDDGVVTRNLKLIAKTPTNADEGAGSASKPVMVHVYTAQTAYMG